MACCGEEGAEDIGHGYGYDAPDEDGEDLGVVVDGGGGLAVPEEIHESVAMEGEGGGSRDGEDQHKAGNHACDGTELGVFFDSHAREDGE